MKVFFTVTNDLVTDQRMMRICSSLAKNGYEVTLVGAEFRSSQPLPDAPFQLKRLRCVFSTGKLFYVEYQLKLLIYLIFQRMNGICAIDLDTIIPCYIISRLKNIPRIYDAHELFCEMKEVVLRPRIYKTWKLIERTLVPRFQAGYTVNSTIAHEFERMYGVAYKVIANMPVLQAASAEAQAEDFIIYQGAVNEGRCFETLIPAMKMVDHPLRIYGDGNFMSQARKLVEQHNLSEKVLFMGRVYPEILRQVTPRALIGVTVADHQGLNNYLSLTNRFFDYIQAELPQICVDYPEYRRINNEYEVALLVSDASEASIASGINKLLTDRELYARLKSNCRRARMVYNWSREEEKLLAFYAEVLPIKTRESVSPAKHLAMQKSGAA